MKLCEKILLATDFNKAARDAVQTVVHLGKTFNSEVVLIHVIPVIHDSPYTVQMMEAVARKKLKETQSLIENEGVQVVERIIASGIPFEQITEKADIHQVNVIVIGSGERAERDKVQLGVTAERLVRRANKPVWIVKRDMPPEIGRILCPVDFSESSSRALRNAIHLARKFQAGLTVLNAIPPLSSSYVEATQDTKDKWAQQQEARFDSFLKGADFHRVQWNKSIRHGQSHREILDAVREEKTDLLVMGSVGQTSGGQVLLGHVAEKVMQEMPCSVITVKSEHVIRLRLDAAISNIEQQFRQGRDLLEGGFPAEALQEFQACIAKAPTYAPALEGIAAAHRRLGNDKEAEKFREKAKYIRESLWAQEVTADIRVERFGKKS